MTTEAPTAPENGQAQDVIDPTTKEIVIPDRPPVGGKLATVKSSDHGDNAVLFDRATFEQAWSVAALFSRSKLVPQHFRGAAEDCFIACQLAVRLKMDPFAVMQGLYVVHGKPGFEGKFIIAILNSSGIFKDALDFEFSGEMGKDDWCCTVSAVRKSTGKMCRLPFRFAIAKAEKWVDKADSKWKTMPEQMMMYRAAAFFARVYAPEALMGMKSVDELEDIGGDPSLSDLPVGRSSFRPETSDKPAASEATKPTEVERPKPVVSGEVVDEAVDKQTGEVKKSEPTKLEPLFGGKPRK